MFKQYLYISTAPSLTREDVNEILASSARNNPESGVTGFLLYNGRNFLQLLEGEEAALDDLMSRIHKDERHTGVSMLSAVDIEDRTCPEWDMKRVFISESIENRRQMLEQGLPENLDEKVRAMILNFAVLN